LLWGLIALLAVAAIVIFLLLIRRPAKVYQAQLAETQKSHETKSEATHSTDTLPATTPLLEAASSKLVMPEGNEILLAGNARSFGRHDFEGFMPHDDISYISRQHVNIWYENGQYYTEDRSSTNGTKINSTNIKGTGRHALADGDVIELAGKLRIVFKENIDKEVQ
jgi:pSer/pThr/pTyr-binding forkhead associated (FHA) protein